MFNARQAKEIELEVLNEIDVLQDLAKPVAEKGISILALSSTAAGKNAIVRLITDDNLRACDALRKKNYNPVERPVVLAEVPHKPGMFRLLAEKLGRAGVGITRVIATAALAETTALVVLSCTDNERAVVVLNE